MAGRSLIGKLAEAVKKLLESRGFGSAMTNKEWAAASVLESSSMIVPGMEAVRAQTLARANIALETAREERRRNKPRFDEL